MLLAVTDIDSVLARSLRDRLVDGIAARGDLRDERVEGALRAVPRHWFVPGVELSRAYEDVPVPIGRGQTISQPTIVAVMTEALALRGHERVLEIGTGCGYQTAILAALAREVMTLELLPELARGAWDRLAGLGLGNIDARVGDGYRGWPERAPFDRIVLTAAPRALPEGLLAQLADGGRLVAPVGETSERADDDFEQRLVCITRRGEAFDEVDLCGVRFVPMVRRDPECLN